MSESRGDVLSILGLARRAGGVAAGTAAVRQAIRDGRAQVIVMAKDASAVQLDKIRSTIHNRTIPQVYLGDRNTLGAAIGSAPLAALAVTNPSLADRLLRELGRGDGASAPDPLEARR